MAADNIDTSPGVLGSSLTELAVHDLVRWNGIVAQVSDVAHLAPGHDQVVLERVDRRALPVSVPLSDLTGAEVWHFAGQLQRSPLESDK
jgi:hypothetical protein